MDRIKIITLSVIAVSIALFAEFYGIPSARAVDCHGEAHALAATQLELTTNVSDDNGAVFCSDDAAALSTASPFWVNADGSFVYVNIKADVKTNGLASLPTIQFPATLVGISDITSDVAVTSTPNPFSANGFSRESSTLGDALTLSCSSLAAGTPVIIFIASMLETEFTRTDNDVVCFPPSGGFDYGYMSVQATLDYGAGNIALTKDKCNNPTNSLASDTSFFAMNVGDTINIFAELLVHNKALAFGNVHPSIFSFTRGEFTFNIDIYHTTLADTSSCVLTSASGRSYGASLYLPSLSGGTDFAPGSTPILNSNPSDAKPWGVGNIAQGALNLSVGFPQFSAPADIYLAIAAPAISQDLWLIKPDNSLQPLSSGIVKWRENTSGPVLESLYGDIAVSTLPTGTYALYALVSPAGDLNTYYLWSAAFTLP